MKNISDDQAIESVKKGNQADYSILIDRYKNKAFSLLKGMLKNEMEAEEVLQDCFVKAFYALNEFRQDAKFSTWFYKIVYNTALSKLSSRKRKIESEMSSVDDHYDLELEGSDNFSELNDRSVFIKEILIKLPQKYCAVLNMFYLEGLSCDEIAEVMEASVSNVKVLLHRSRNAFKDYIEKNNLKEELI